MRVFLLAYCVGILLVTWTDDVSSNLTLCTVAIGLLCVAVLFAHRWLRRGKIQIRCAQVVMALLLGSCWHLIWAEGMLRQRLPITLEGRDITVTGIVLGLPTTNSAARQFQFYIEHSGSGFERRKVLLNSYEDWSLQTGQRWQLRVRLNRPHGYANPGGFDYEAWLFQQGIAAKGYVRQHADNQLLEQARISSQSFRESTRERLIRHGAELRNLGILQALTLGDRSRLQSEDWQLMSASGTNHLFVISGLHIGLIAAGAYWLGSWLLCWQPGLSLYYPRQKTAAWLALLAAFLYSLLAGFTLPTQRAFIMTAVFVVCQISARPAPVSLRFLLALAGVLTLNPLATTSGGFWLSFMAVAALLLAASGALLVRHEATTSRLVAYWIKPQLVVFLALVPLLLYWTRQLSLIAPVINLLAIPLIGFVVVPVSLLGVCLLFVADTLALPVLKVSDYLLDYLFAALAWLYLHVPWVLLSSPVIPIPVLCCLGVAVLLMLLPVRRALRWLVVPLMLPLLFPVANQVIPKGTIVIHILDVGQGLSVIASTQKHTLVYDTGAALSAEFDLGAAVVAPVLQQMGVQQVDKLLVSHFDNDHAGGMVGLLDAIPVQQVLSSDPRQAAQRLQSALVPVPSDRSQACVAGQSWTWDEVQFAVLHPLQPFGSGNNNSCVLHIQTGDLSLLLPGDIERGAERELVLREGSDLGSSVLIAPHHGSNSSSTYAFIKQVAPRYVVYTAGYRNSFGHPTVRTQQRYAEMGAMAYITHHTGMLTFRLQPDAPLQEPVQFRQSQRRYWH